MAEYVYGSGVPYGQYLQENAYVRDITGQIKKRGDATRQEISSQTRELVASNERLSQEFGAGFNAVNGTLEIGFNRVESALCNVEASIESLHSDFNYNIGLVLDQLQIQNQLTYGILEKLDAIHKTLENPRLTQARECYNIGCERLSKGLLDKALEAFLKSEERNDTHFFTQFQIGKLYLYGVNEDDYVIDLVKAEHHLRNAARYGKAEISVFPEFRRWTGEALLNASIACYLQANEQRINGNTDNAKEFISKAFQLTQMVSEIYPTLSEGHYHHAKYAALLEEVGTSLDSLEKSIRADVNYCLKIEFDNDFRKIRPQVSDLFMRIREELHEKATRLLQEYQQKNLNMVYLTDDAKNIKQEIIHILNKIEILMKKNTILDLDEAFEKINKVESTLSSNKYTFFNKYSIETKDFAINLTGTLVAVTVYLGGKLWELELRRAFDGEILYKLPKSQKPYVNISFSSDGKLLATCEYPDILKLWQVIDGELIRTIHATLNGTHNINEVYEISLDCKFIAIKDKNDVKIWQVINGKLIAVFNDIWRFKLSPDGKTIAVKNYKDETNKVKILDVIDGKLLHTISGYVWSFSNDGKLIAINSDNKTQIWQVSNGKLVYSDENFSIPVFRKNTIKLLQVIERKLTRNLIMAFSNDEKLMATFDMGIEIRLVSDGKILQKISGNYPYAQFSPDGKVIAIMGKKLELRRVSDGKLLDTLPAGSFSQDWESFIASNEGDYGITNISILGRQIISKGDLDKQQSLKTKKIRIKKKDDINPNSAKQEIMEASQKNSEMAEGVCLVCGNKLSFFDKLRGKTTCSKHSS